MRPSCAVICHRDGRQRHIATFCLLVCISAPSAVVSFAHPRPTTPRSSSSAIRVAKHGGAVVCRKKKQTSDDRGFECRQEEYADDIYSMPPLYDLAFGYRSYEDEVSFLLDVHSKYSYSASDEPLRILELAAGPTRHSLATLSKNPPSKFDSVLAMDASHAMVDYGMENADHPTGRDRWMQGRLPLRQGRHEESRRQYAIVLRLRLDAAGIYSAPFHERGRHRYARTLNIGDTVVMEFSNPRETFGMGECTRNGLWTVPLVMESMDGDVRMGSTEN
ncbi:hypothetical protein ACHAWF_016656 [Thalassiosira exigua]